MNNAIKVGAFDELASIIDEILEKSSDTVFLEVSDDAYIAQNVLNFRLIKREADTVGKNIVIVSNNARIRGLASKASLQTRINLPSSVGKLSASQEFTHRSGVRMVTDIIGPKEHHLMREKNKVQDIKSVLPPVTHIPVFKEKEIEKDNFLQNLRAKVRPAVKDTVGQEAVDIVKKINSYSEDIQKEEPFYQKSTQKVKKPRATFNRIKQNPKRFLIIFSASVVLGVLSYLLIFVFPSATVTLHPKTAQDTMNISMFLDSNISSSDLSKGSIQAQLLEERRENNFTFKATGEADVAERARGQVRVYNEFSSEPQTLVANTRFLSSEGKLFRTSQTIVVPGASISGGKIIPSSILVDVVADEPGKDFNIGPTTFSIPGFKGTDKYLAFYGKNEQDIQGGFKGKATVVTQEDIDKAQQEIGDEFLKNTDQALREKIPSNLMVIEETFEAEFETIESTARAQEPTEEFTIRVVAVARTFLVRQEDIRDLIDYYFINSTEYSKDYELSDKRVVEYAVKEIDYEKGYVDVSLNIKQLFNRKFSIDDLYNELMGKDEIEVRKILSSKDGLQEAEVGFWPLWVRKIPKDIERVNIKIEYRGELQ